MSGAVDARQHGPKLDDFDWIRENVSRYETQQELCAAYNAAHGTSFTRSFFGHTCNRKLNLRWARQQYHDWNDAWIVEHWDEYAGMSGKASAGKETMWQAYNRVHGTDISDNTFYSRCRKLGLKRRPHLLEHERYTREQVEFIRKNYPIMTYSQFAAEWLLAFGEHADMGKIGTKANDMGCAKLPETIHATRREQNGKRSSQIGDIMENYGYNYVRVDAKPGQKKWRSNGRVVWEKANGTIPKGHFIIHLDGDSHNDDLSNLECIPCRWLGYISRFAGGRGANSDAWNADTIRAKLEWCKLQDAIREAKGEKLSSGSPGGNPKGRPKNSRTRNPLTGKRLSAKQRMIDTGYSIKEERA